MVVSKFINMVGKIINKESFINSVSLNIEQAAISKVFNFCFRIEKKETL